MLPTEPNSIFTCCAVAYDNGAGWRAPFIGPNHFYCYRTIKNGLGYIPKDRVEEGFILSMSYCIKHKIDYKEPMNRFVNRARAYEIYLEEGYEPLENPAFFGEHLWNKE